MQPIWEDSPWEAALPPALQQGGLAVATARILEEAERDVPRRPVEEKQAEPTCCDICGTVVDSEDIRGVIPTKTLGTDDDSRTRITHCDNLECWSQAHLRAGHPPASECPEDECMVCSMRDCPHSDPLHYHHDGCGSCDG
jgi:hypothetical protein